MTDLIDTTEMYLRTIFELEEEGIVPLRARIAERLGHSGPTVSQTVARMERDGLLRVSDERHLELSEVGRDLATRVMRKHRLAERLLVDVLGLDWSLAHDEACRWEHVISEQVERRILAVLAERDASVGESPYGNPIPGLPELGADTPSEPFRDGVISLTDVPGLRLGPDPVPVVVRRMGEPAQVDPQTLSAWAGAGLRPGARASITLSGNEFRVEIDGGGVVLIDPATAGHLFVDVT